MKRAVFLHNQICGLLLSAYEHLQNHINKLLVHLNEFERKKINIGNFSTFFFNFLISKLIGTRFIILKKKSIAKKNYANCAKSSSNVKTRTFWTIWQIETWHNARPRTSCNGACTSTISPLTKPFRLIWPWNTTTNE